MSSAERLLELYAAAFRAGNPDPWPFLDQAEGEERDELQQLMDMFLISVEPHEWDQKSFADSPFRAMADRIAENLIVPAGGWPELLPSLRMRKKIKRDRVDAELARALDAEGPGQTEKVAIYYHDMEQGNLDPGGVSGSVLAALSEIYGTTVELLRRAGSATEPPGSADGTVFARVVGDTDEDFVLSAEDTKGFTRVKGEPDRIDRLFTDPDYEDPGR